MAACATDVLSLSARDTALLIVPLFHVSAWSMPYAGAIAGSNLVLPGPGLDGESVYNIMRDTKVNIGLGVPSVWSMFFQYIKENQLDTKVDLEALERVVIGGSACPRSMIEAFHEMGVFTIHAWGMTETSPLGTVGNLLPHHDDLPLEDIVDVQTLQGRRIYGIELKITDDDNKTLPKDGETVGHIKVRGPWVASAYHKRDPVEEDADKFSPDGWLTTGDIGCLTPDGYLRITDRDKDVVKSGGEFVSSIDLENAAMGHPDIREAAVIAVKHSKWEERPLLVVVRDPESSLSDQDLTASINDFLSTKVAKWWLPDDVVYVDQLPYTATGKLLKRQIREDFADYVLPTDPLYRPI